MSLCLALLAWSLPASAAAAEGPGRIYMVVLDVAGSGRVIEPGSRQARARIAARSERAAQVTERLRTQQGIEPRHRYDSAVTGFSARMTPAQARALAEDPKVASVRPARQVRLASQAVQPGVARVKAVISGGPVADVDADVAVIDTGIGPSTGQLGVPAPMGPADDPELNIAGGVNCYHGPSGAVGNDKAWADTYGHGTHVAGIIGARDNAVGTVGVAPGVRLWSVRVFGEGYGTEDDVVCGLEWVFDHSDEIDVVNMSLEVDRIDQNENCATATDPIQIGICQVVGTGVTVVGAAGNQRENANRWIPGGLDDVISVGAMTDTDGEGWGAGGNARCSGYTSQHDDTYARAYSNYGPDVDIVAPGTCVRSTARNASGDETTVMTGTSMAAPHVTGAVARYLAAHPGTAPDRVQRLVRASGRLDWDPRSDPLWSGPGDTDPPNRVLDVSALTGKPGLKTWVYHDTLWVPGKIRSRTTRVDLQRSGGYGDEVSLSTTALPGGSKATFVRRRLTGLGAANLGTNVRFEFGLAGAQGRFRIGVRADAPDVDAYTRYLRLVVDRVGPRVTRLAPKVRKVMLTRSGSASVRVTWRATDAVSTVAKAKLQRRTGASGAWKGVPRSRLRSARVQLKPGQSDRFRVKAIDSLGNRRWSGSVGARLVVRDSDSGLWRRTGAWKTRRVAKALGGSILITHGASGSLATDFHGKAAAIAASVGPNRGTLQVRVDGGAWQSVSLKQVRSRHRKVIWTTRLAQGSHTIELRGQRGQSTVDALLFVR